LIDQEVTNMLDHLGTFPALRKNIAARALEEAKAARKAKLSGTEALSKVLLVIERYPGAKALFIKPEAQHVARRACALAGYQEFIRDTD
jgi:hypothetical protein